MVVAWRDVAQGRVSGPIKGVAGFLGVRATDGKAGEDRGIDSTCARSGSRNGMA